MDSTKRRGRAVFRYALIVLGVLLVCLMPNIILWLKGEPDIRPSPKPTLLVVTAQKFADHAETLATVSDFADDVPDQVAVVVADPGNEDDRARLDRLDVADSLDESQVIVMFRGRTLGTVSGAPTRDQLQSLLLRATTLGGCGT